SEKQKKILNKAKWKARFQNAIIALSLFVIVSFICSFITHAFYGWGNRGEVYTNVVKSTIAVTEPNVQINRSNISPNVFFTMDWKGNLSKQIGNDVKSCGQLNIQYLFHLPIDVNKEIEDKQKGNFIHPNTGENVINNE